jgi:hypothetical protein
LSAVAERYAAALADVALERKSGEAVRKDLAAFVETFLASADLRNALESPAVDGAVKNKVITAIGAKMGLNDAVRGARRLDRLRRLGARAIEPAARAARNGIGATDGEHQSGRNHTRSCASRSKTTSRRSRSMKWARSSPSATASRAFTAWKSAWPARCCCSRTMFSESR